MRLKVGELAKRSGLTVRTLHHYHATVSYTHLTLPTKA